MNGVWTRICPILGLLLLLSVCSLLSDSKYQENSDNSYLKQAKCISGSNSFPEGDNGCLNAVLNRWCNGQRQCHIPAKLGNFCIRQDQGNSFKIYQSLSSFLSTKIQSLLHNLDFRCSFSSGSSMLRDFYEKGYAQINQRDISSR